MNLSTFQRSGRLSLLLALALLLVAMLFTIPAGLASAQDELPFGENVVTATTTANLRIRSSPSLEAEILTVLPTGTVVGFTGLTDETGDWVLVDASDGPTGWVWASNLSNVPDGLTVWSADGAADEEEVADEQSPFGEDVVTATTKVNLHIRSAPNLDAEILSTLPTGTVVGFTGLTDETGDWVQVDAADGPIGWVSVMFLSNVPDELTVLSPAGTASVVDVVDEQSPFGEDVVTATTTVNLHIRSAPNLDAEILTTLPTDTIVGFTGLTDESGNWVQVDAADGPIGWVSAMFLSNVPDDLTVWTGDENA